MPATRDLQSFGFVYGIYGNARGTTTSSAVLAIPTSFGKRVVAAFAWDEGFIGRNNAADPSQTTGPATFTYFQPITPNGTIARFRVLRVSKPSSASAVVGVSIGTTWASALTGLRARWLAFGY